MGSIINNQRLGGQNFTTSYKGVTVTGMLKSYPTYADMLADERPGKFAFVADATGDTTVNRGFALYYYKGSSWKKFFEEEAMDQDGGIVVNTRWENIIGKPTVSPRDIDDAVPLAHSHNNRDVLAGFTEGESGLLYKGEPVATGTIPTARYLQLIRPIDTQNNVSLVVEGYSDPLMTEENRLFTLNSAIAADASKIRYYGWSDSTGTLAFLPVNNEAGIPYAETAGRFVIVDLDGKNNVETIFLRWRWYDVSIGQTAEGLVAESACVYPSITPSSTESIGLVWKGLSEQP